MKKLNIVAGENKEDIVRYINSKGLRDKQHWKSLIDKGMKFWFLKRGGKIINETFYDPNYIKKDFDLKGYIENMYKEIYEWKEWPRNYSLVPSSGEFERIIAQTVPSKRF